MSLRDSLDGAEEAPKKSLIKKAIDLVDTAVEKLKAYQKGEETPIKTRYAHFNENSLGGIFSQMIITIAGISGSGKTFVLQQIENDVFDKELNPKCDDYILLRCNWEMPVFKLLLRKLKQKMNRSMKWILFNTPIGSELLEFQAVVDSERRGDIYYLEEPCDPKTWYDAVRSFILENKKKKQIIVTIDHIALVRDLLGSKKKAMDDLVEYINSLKKEFNNVSFIVVSQMNRDIESRTDVRHMAPKRSDLYNTDTLFQISDIVLVIHNPYRLGIDRYMIIRPDQYPYLTNEMVKPSSKTTNFETRNKIFWHYLKIREIEDVEHIKDVHVEHLAGSSLRDELVNKMKDKITHFEADMNDLVEEPSDPEVHTALPDEFMDDNEDDDGLAF